MEFFNKKGQPIGTLKEGVFRKRVDRDRHLMRIYDAWGIQYEVIQQIKEECKEIRIKDMSDGTVYSISFKDFMQKAHVEDHGDGMQAFCERQNFTTSDKKQTMKEVSFHREFTVGEPSEHEYEHYIKLTAKILNRPYFQVHKMLESVPVDEIKRWYTLCTKHNGDMASDVYWWWTRKKYNENTHTKDEADTSKPKKHSN